MACMTERALASFRRLALRQTNKHTSERDSVNIQTALSFLAFVKVCNPDCPKTLFWELSMLDKCLPNNTER